MFLHGSRVFNINSIFMRYIFVSVFNLIRKNLDHIVFMLNEVCRQHAAFSFHYMEREKHFMLNAPYEGKKQDSGASGRILMQQNFMQLCLTLCLFWGGGGYQFWLAHPQSATQREACSPVAFLRWQMGVCRFSESVCDTAIKQSNSFCKSRLIEPDPPKLVGHKPRTSNVNHYILGWGVLV